MPWKPSFPGERPTLGYYVLDWMQENLAMPNREYYEPFTPTQEQADFALGFYELNPITGKRVVRRGVLSRSRGWGKSPWLSALAIVEALADVVPDGWDAAGQPVGKPWVSVRTPYVAVAAATEAQTINSWGPLLEMLGEHAPVLENYPGLEPLQGFVNLPIRGKILPITASATSSKGLPMVFVVMDQTEMWTFSNGGTGFATVLINNATKIGGSVIESPNAFTPGLKSVAEKTAEAYFAMAAGQTKRQTGLLYDHREAYPDTDLGDEASLVAGLRYAYGDSSDHPDGCVIHDPPCAPGWAPIDQFVSRIWDLDSDEADSRADFLNQITKAADSWVSAPDWKACHWRSDPMRPPVDPPTIGDVITLGFDGSRGRAKGKPDATALIGTRVRDGFMFQLGVWEALDQEKSTWDQWEPPIVEIEATLEDAFDRYNVYAFYADPGRDWRSHVNAWEARWGNKVKLKSRPQHPFEWWMSGGRSGMNQQAIEQLEGAIRNRDMIHDGSLALTRHVLNSRRRLSHGKLALGKVSDYSERKIDAAVAGVLSWQARLDAVAHGAGIVRQRVVPRRIR